MDHPRQQREAGVRVLVVDDHPGNRALVSDVVEATSGFTAVGSAASGEEALRWLGRRRADLVLLDVRMPGVGGVAAARAAARLPRPPVIVLVSGDDRPDIAADPRAYGAAAFIRKDALSSRVLQYVWLRHAAPVLA